MLADHRKADKHSEHPSDSLGTATLRVCARRQQCGHFHNFVTIKLLSEWGFHIWYAWSRTLGGAFPPFRAIGKKAHGLPTREVGKPLFGGVKKLLEL
jgi:hypothetical protein